MHHHPTSHSGFTLLELSIVLAILGLLVGAVFGGTAMVNQSRLQTVIADYTKYAAATAEFKQQYGGMPGDLLDATNYWGSDAANCSTANNLTPGTCNGDGDDVIPIAGAEALRAWQQLMLAKLITGNYSGSGTLTIGTNVPGSRMPKTGWSFGNTTAGAGTEFWNQNLGNVLIIGAPMSSTTAGAGLYTFDAQLLDKKMDDGVASSGFVMSPKYSTSTYAPDCADWTSQYYIYQGWYFTAKKSCSLVMTLNVK